ncbi:MAG: hypothetical protein HYR56_08150 [Acidobacteria bacterium]|nr:hypothetical protein [Acidobacteriota bacterium]MBI3426098.1 hypothetical protein [Acidobacteriota bacterium]
MNKLQDQTIQFALCLNNADYKASLEVGKLYQVIPDPSAEKHGYLRIVDESGEDYAFTANRFHLLTLPHPIEQTLLAAVRL